MNFFENIRNGNRLPRLCRRATALLLTAVLTAGLCGCGGGTTKMTAALWENCEIVEAQVDRVMSFVSLEAIQKYYGSHESCCLVRLSVTDAGTNVYKGEKDLGLSRVETPVRIEEICFAGEEIPLQVGDETIVRENYVYIPSEQHIFSTLATTPLVAGHEFFAVFSRISAENANENCPEGTYVVECCYPVEPYENFPEFDNFPWYLRHPGARNGLLETYGAGSVSGEAAAPSGNNPAGTAPSDDPLKSDVSVIQW